jgi:hypothetical protein
VPGSEAWTDTGLDVKAGDVIKIEATGELQFKNAAKPAGPGGAPRGWADMIKTYPVNEAGRGALIGRIGEISASMPFLVGEKREVRAATTGRLFLGLNFAGGDSGEGAFTVKIERVPATATTPVRSGPMPKVTQAQLNSVPTRVADKDGNPGDRTNFVIIGSEKKLRKALEDAGWVTVDRSVQQSILTGVLGALNKKAYVSMPMSELYLFGRAQDYGYAKGDPVSVVATRHHFRIWKAPFTAGGNTVWIGAGTHDTGFDKDQRNGKVTHKIDPDTDLEREFIGKSLTEVGAVAETGYMTPANPIKKANTAHGEEFTSDGRTLLIWLGPDEPDEAR